MMHAILNKGIQAAQLLHILSSVVTNEREQKKLSRLRSTIEQSVYFIKQATVDRSQAIKALSKIGEHPDSYMSSHALRLTLIMEELSYIIKSIGALPLLELNLSVVGCARQAQVRGHTLGIRTWSEISKDRFVPTDRKLRVAIDEMIEKKVTFIPNTNLDIKEKDTTRNHDYGKVLSAFGKLVKNSEWVSTLELLDVPVSKRIVYSTQLAQIFASRKKEEILQECYSVFEVPSHESSGKARSSKVVRKATKKDVSAVMPATIQWLKAPSSKLYIKFDVEEFTTHPEVKLLISNLASTLCNYGNQEKSNAVFENVDAILKSVEHPIPLAEGVAEVVIQQKADDLLNKVYSNLRSIFDEVEAEVKKNEDASKKKEEEALKAALATALSNLDAKSRNLLKNNPDLLLDTLKS